MLHGHGHRHLKVPGVSEGSSVQGSVVYACIMHMVGRMGQWHGRPLRPHFKLPVCVCVARALRTGALSHLHLRIWYNVYPRRISHIGIVNY